MFRNSSSNLLPQVRQSASKEGRKLRTTNARPSPSLPPFPGRALARQPFACSSVTADAAAPAAPSAAAAAAAVLGQWKMRASLARSHAQSVRRRSRRGSQLDARRPRRRWKDSRQDRQGRTRQPPLSLGLGLRAIFTQPGVGARRALRTDGRTGDSNLRFARARDSSPSPFHSALLHNSNVEGKNGRGGRTRFPRIGFRVVVIEDRRRKSESSVSVV